MIGPPDGMRPKYPNFLAPSDELPPVVIPETGTCPGCGTEFGLREYVRLDGTPDLMAEERLHQCPTCDGQWVKAKLTRKHYSLVTERISKNDYLTGMLTDRARYAISMNFGRLRRRMENR